MATKSSHPDWLAKEKDIPKDLTPMFYKLKADQKLYQVSVSMWLMRFHMILSFKKKHLNNSFWIICCNFQKADGIPIHFKRGARDKILCGITCAGILVGLVSSAQFVYSLP